MRGFYVGHKDEFVKKLDIPGGGLGLMAKAQGLEFMKYELLAGKEMYLNQGGDSNAIEYFYILKGQLVIVENQVVLSRGDSFYITDIDKAIKLRSLLDLELLYVSSAPVFDEEDSTNIDVQKLATVMDEKDQYTKGHCERVAKYATSLAEYVNVSSYETKLVVYASLYHDLGKIDIANEILNKPGRLTDEEFAEIKKHPEFGKVLAGTTHYKEVAEIVGQHHERLDGSGYPDGLKGDEINYLAKLIAVVDSYDAMTSDRPYRKGLRHEVAIEELIGLKGIHYDAKLVEAFVEMMDENKVHIDL